MEVTAVHQDTGVQCTVEVGFGDTVGILRRTVCSALGLPASALSRTELHFNGADVVPDSSLLDSIHIEAGADVVMVTRCLEEMLSPTEYTTGHCVFSVRISTCNTFCLASLDNGTVQVWDTQRGHHISTLRHSESDYVKVVLGIAISPCSEWVYTCDRTGDIVKWNLPNATKEASLNAHTQGVHCVEVSPCGDYLLSGSTDRTVKVWKDDSVVRSLVGHRRTVVGLAMCGEIVVSCAADGIRMTNYLTGEILRVLDQAASAVAWTPCGRHCVASSKHHVHVFSELDEDIVSFPSPLASPLSSISVSACGTLLVVTGADEVSCVRITDGTVLGSFARQYLAMHNTVVSPCGRYLLVSTEEKVLVTDMFKETG